ncbi:MAG: T9SS type A sorting domain-containing protein [Nevskiales bacterium]|nr:T9SS type A sorting domain-containing protein [Nevskiales bacterium]
MHELNLQELHREDGAGQRRAKGLRAIALTAAIVAGLGPLAVCAAQELPPAQYSGTVEFRVGGFGETEADAMKAATPRYPLALNFVERGSDGRSMYTSDVGVRITDTVGTTRLDTVANGPIMLIKLPAGTYTITATLEGRSKTQKVNIGQSGHERIVFSWPEMSS